MKSDSSSYLLTFPARKTTARSKCNYLWSICSDMFKETEWSYVGKKTYPSNERKNIISICPPPKKEHQIRKKLARDVTKKYALGRLLFVDFWHVAFIYKETFRIVRIYGSLRPADCDCNKGDRHRWSTASYQNVWIKLTLRIRQGNHKAENLCKGNTFWVLCKYLTNLKNSNRQFTESICRHTA